MGARAPAPCEVLSVWGEQNIFCRSSSLLPKLPWLEDMAKKRILLEGELPIPIFGEVMHILHIAISGQTSQIRKKLIFVICR